MDIHDAQESVLNYDLEKEQVKQIALNHFHAYYVRHDMNDVLAHIDEQVQWKGSKGYYVAHSRREFGTLLQKELEFVPNECMMKVVETSTISLSTGCYQVTGELELRLPYQSNIYYSNLRFTMMIIKQDKRFVIKSIHTSSTGESVLVEEPHYLLDEDTGHLSVELKKREQYDTVTELIAPEGIQAFVPDTVDNVKYVFRTDVLEKDFKRYFSNYVAMGLQNPREYLLAWVELIRPYWDMTRNEYKGLAFYYSFPERNRWGIQREEQGGFFGKVFSFLYNVIQSSECNFFWRPETCLWILAALPGLAVARKRKSLFLSVMPLGLYFGTALLGPVALLRYLFPLTMATPLLLGMLFGREAAIH